MIALHNFKSAEFREKAAQIILETLARLPETYRNIFVWNHYQGRSVSQIAEMLDWKSPEIEAALDAIGSTLYQRTRGLLAHYPQVPNTYSGDEIKSSGRIKTAEAQSYGRLGTSASAGRLSNQ